MRLPVLKIRDANGNFIPINAIRGENGKSAYEQAKEGGYKGTEQEFIALLNGLTNSEDADHYSDFDNPHNVTAEQTGAIEKHYYTSDDLNVELTLGGGLLELCCYDRHTLNTPYTLGATAFAHGMVITNAYDVDYATQLCMPSGSDILYIRALNGQGISDWEPIPDISEISSMLENITNLEMEVESRLSKLEETASEKATVGTDFYMGTGDCGNTNPTTIEISPTTQAVIVYCATQYTMMSPLTCLRGQFESVYYHPTTKATILNMEWTNTQLKIWHASSAEAQFNKEGTRYGYMLING